MREAVGDCRVIQEDIRTCGMFQVATLLFSEVYVASGYFMFGMLQECSGSPRRLYVSRGVCRSSQFVLRVCRKPYDFVGGCLKFYQREFFGVHKKFLESLLLFRRNQSFVGCSTRFRRLQEILGGFRSIWKFLRVCRNVQDSVGGSSNLQTDPRGFKKLLGYLEICRSVYQSRNFQEDLGHYITFFRFLEALRCSNNLLETRNFQRYLLGLESSRSFGVS